MFFVRFANITHGLASVSASARRQKGKWLRACLKIDGTDYQPQTDKFLVPQSDHQRLETGGTPAVLHGFG
jgi:hypothetical protein